MLAVSNYAELEITTNFFFMNTELTVQTLVAYEAEDGSVEVFLPSFKLSSKAHFPRRKYSTVKDLTFVAQLL